MFEKIPEMVAEDELKLLLYPVLGSRCKLIAILLKNEEKLSIKKIFRGRISEAVLL